MHAILTLFLLVGAMVAKTLGYATYQAQIPNGYNVPNPCLSGQTWNGVGHQSYQGGGARNPFGLDFAKNGHVWNSTLCRLDSDGDGKTNGAELGDPGCTWVVNSPPSQSTGLSHPGICEPVDSATCLSKNAWLSCSNNSPGICSAVSAAGVKNVTYRIPPTSIPTTETTYTCFTFLLPNDTSYHLIAAQPAVNNDLLHHMLMFGCGSNFKPDNYPNPVEECYMPLDACSDIIGLWSHGLPGICYDNAYGFAIGGAAGYKYAMLQMHWNNPQNLVNQTDNSGMTLFYTSKLRPNDANVLAVGQESFTIPPQQPAYHVTGTCPRQCTSPNLQRSVYIADVALHMHTLGQSISLSLYRNGVKVQVVIRDDNYDYNSPQYHALPIPVEMKPGDELVTECVYNTTNRLVETTFGMSTQSEMCYSFVVYYPAVPAFTNCIQIAQRPFYSCAGTLVTPDCDFAGLAAVLTELKMSKVCEVAGSCTSACADGVRRMRDTRCLNLNDQLMQTHVLGTLESYSPGVSAKVYYLLAWCPGAQTSGVGGSVVLTHALVAVVVVITVVLS